MSDNSITRAPSPPPWTSAEDDLLREHTRQGVGRKRSALLLGRAYWDVRKRVHVLRLGKLPAGANGRVWTTTRLRDAAALKAAGLSYRQIAARYGLGSWEPLHSGLARLERGTAHVG